MEDGSHPVCYAGYGPQSLNIRATGSYHTKHRLLPYDHRFLPYGPQVLTIWSTGSYLTDHRLLPYGPQVLTLWTAGS